MKKQSVWECAIARLAIDNIQRCEDGSQTTVALVRISPIKGQRQARVASRDFEGVEQGYELFGQIPGYQVPTSEGWIGCEYIGFDLY